MRLTEEMTMGGSTMGCIVILLLSLLTAPLTCQAQPAAPVPRLGLLIPGSASGFASRIVTFRYGLCDLGYIESRTIAIEYRFADGHADRLPALVAELACLPVDAIVVDGILTIWAAQQATTTILIAMAVIGHPVGTGLWSQRGRPISACGHVGGQDPQRGQASRPAGGADHEV
jgi:hypothetical protein